LAARFTVKGNAMNHAPLTHVRAAVRDNVAVALVDLPEGFDLGQGVKALEPIKAGHKIALEQLNLGDDIIKLGQPIGKASAAIARGAHVHVHNVAFAGQVDRSNIGSRIVEPVSAPAQFMGYLRADGRVGTRNYIGLLTSVNCSATVARRIADHFTPERLAGFANVDGVVAFTHMSGCGMAKSGRGMENLRRTIGGYAKHANFAAILIVGLGCEVNQIDPMLDDQGLEASATLRVLGIQDAGGTRAAIDAGIAEVEAMLPIANAMERSAQSAAHLTLGLQCGASDGYSALTANPALGRAADKLVATGGKVVLSETPEIFGAENLLLERAADPAIADRLVERLNWWENYAACNGSSLNNNPSPGNIAGGITTILEKSLGAVAKAGTSPLRDVIDYAAPIVTQGLSFMDTPGYDPCSATGQIAGGANLIAFTTGRGSVFGSKPAPTIKLASNSALAAKMADDIDVDCGRMISGEASLDALGEEIFALLLDVASGNRTASERNDIGDNEFVPWVPGAAL
jgi:altronate hydrolase